MRLRELSEQYIVLLDQERYLLRRMVEIQRELDETKERMWKAKAQGRRVLDDELDAADKLTFELREVQSQYDEILDDQARLRNEIAWEEYRERRRRLLEGRAQDQQALEL